MKKLLLFTLDAVVLYLSLVLMLVWRYKEDFSLQYQTHILPFSYIFALWLLVFYIANLYEIRLLRNNIHFYTALSKSIGIAGTISVLFFYLIPFYGITPKTNLLIFLVIFAILEFASRYIFNRIVEKGFKKRVLIVGSDSQSMELAKFIKENPQLGYELSDILDLNHTSVKDIERHIQEKIVSIIVLSPESYQIPEIINVFYRSLNHKIVFTNLSSFYERLTGQVPLGAINQIWFLENLNEGNKKAYEISKRGADVLLAIVSGVFVLAILPFIYLVIKLSSEGPVFYKQKRVGQARNTFSIIKFRTMNKDAEKKTGAVWASENDPRVTRVGGIMRKTRIDELPQLWNILKGEMSFVGPRAERPEFHGELRAVPFYEERYLIKPGLTGWAQINFRYGSSVADAAEKLKYDLYYIKNRSLILDLGIILKTIRIALQQSGK